MNSILEQQRNFRRASSTKSLHQTSEDLWNNVPPPHHQSMWDPQRMPPHSTANPMINPMINPMNNPMMFGGQMPPGQIPNTLHRSMHELRMGGSQSTRGPSPTNR